MYANYFEFFKAMVFSLEYVVVKVEMALCWSVSTQWLNWLVNALSLFFNGSLIS